MKCENIKDIVLTPEENEIFMLFKHSDKVFLTVAQYKLLLPTGLIKSSLNNKTGWFDNLLDGYCEISDLGKRYRESLNLKHKADRSENLKYIITTVIAILALLKSYGAGIDDILIWCMRLLKQ